MSMFIVSILILLSLSLLIIFWHYSYFCYYHYCLFFIYVLLFVILSLSMISLLRARSFAQRPRHDPEPLVPTGARSAWRRTTTAQESILATEGRSVLLFILFESCSRILILFILNMLRTNVKKCKKC